VQNTILPRDINVVGYQGKYEEKEAKIKTALNATMMLKLVIKATLLHSFKGNKVKSYIIPKC